MDIVQNRALLLNTKKAAQIKALIPKSEIIEHGPAGAGRILVNWDQHEAQVLRNMGIKNVPSPILGRYKWPGMYNPFEHQKATADFLTVHLKCFVLNEAGTGKTTAAAWAADYLMTKGLVRRVLVVCPLSIMRTAWQADMFKTIMHRKSGVAYGTREVRAKVIGDTTNEFVIINFDGIKTNLHDILAADFDLVIVDEASAFQTTNTERYKCLEKINKPKTRLWMMTGTPAAQSPVGAYGLAKLVNPDAVPRFFGAFRDLVMRKVTTFKYVPRHDAQQTVFRVLQPAIRFTKEECLDLPDITYTSREVEMTPMQWKYYKLIKNDMAATIQTASVTAVNAAALMNKLLQISCLGRDTLVLTDKGWKEIVSVRTEDRVWDGVDWVQHSGVVYQGDKVTITLDGVRITPDHLVLSNAGWKPAGEILDGDASSQFARASVWAPDSCSEVRGVVGANKESHMAVPLRMRERGSPREPEPTGKEQAVIEKLRMPVWEVESKTWNDRHTTTSDMDEDARPVLGPNQQRLEKLWGAWDYCLRALADVREFLGGYGSKLCSQLIAGQNRQLSGIYQGQLPLGNGRGSAQQHADQPHAGHPRWKDVSSPSSAALWSRQGDPAPTPFQTELEFRGGAYDTPQQTEPVYDVVGAGPRSRFTVKSPGGQPFIVHNCGSVYTAEGDTVEFDISSRYRELTAAIDQTDKKVLVFVPFRNAIRMLREKLLQDGYTVEVVDGSVNPNHRTDIFNAFQNEAAPKVLLLQPAATAHGITLHAADTIVWWGPVTSTEIYLQANARAHRAGLKHPVTVIHLVGSPVEVKLYNMLQNRLETHNALVDMYKEELTT